MSPEPDDRLDLAGMPCPQNTARALLVLEMMDEGELLELWLDDGEPIENVPPALELEGHALVGQQRDGQGWRLLVRRGED